jgi:hypothetical protein
MIFPTVLGRGERRFPGGIDRLKRRLADMKTVGLDGIVIHGYRRA